MIIYISYVMTKTHIRLDHQKKLDFADLKFRRFSEVAQLKILNLLFETESYTTVRHIFVNSYKLKVKLFYSIKCEQR